MNECQFSQVANEIIPLISDKINTQLKASSTVSGSFLLRVSGKVNSIKAELNDKPEKITSGSRGEIFCARTGVSGVKILPIRPKTEQMLKNRCLKFVGKTSMVKM